MRVAIIGAGLVGQAIVYLLSQSENIDELTVIDINKQNLIRAKKLAQYDIKTVESNITKNIELVDGYDFVCCALPGNISFDVVRKILMNGISVVDSSFMPQDPFELDSIARDNNAIYIPDAGFAPGLSNMFVGYFYRELKHLGDVKIYVGGLPQKPEGPFFHKVNWSLIDFIDEYLRPARIIRNNKLVRVDPLSDIERIKIAGETFEAFYTDGLRTLLKTIPATNMFEKTIRYVGHLERMLFLRNIGLFSDKTITINGNEVRIREILLWILKNNIYDPELKDRAILYIKVSDRYGKNIREVLIEDSYDEQLRLSAMAKLTGFTNAIITQIASNIKRRGVIPPEELGKDYMDYFLERFLGTTPIKINRTSIEISKIT